MTVAITTEAMARYIADMAYEMSEVARARGLVTLADILRIAQLEAEAATTRPASDDEDNP